MKSASKDWVCLKDVDEGITREKNCLMSNSGIRNSGFKKCGIKNR